jgi:FKBP-type peptidyl-prolyl cis-trans isomerase SlyD
MVVGQTKQVTVLPIDGYGDRLAEGVIEVGKNRIPSQALEVGTKLEVTTPDGKTVYPRIAEIKEETVVLDLNHPLAGKTLYFEVTVLDIQPGSAG